MDHLNGIAAAIKIIDSINAKLLLCFKNFKNDNDDNKTKTKLMLVELIIKLLNIKSGIINGSAIKK